MHTLGDVLETAARELRDLDEEMREDHTRALAKARELLSVIQQRSPAEVALAAHRQEPVSEETQARVHGVLARLHTGMPFAYATGMAAFRHLELAVDQRVLIPRPETELLVDHVLRLRAGAIGGVVADVGTGSGAIALALAQEGHFARVIATDVSVDALTVARHNAERLASQLRTPVEFRLGSDLEPVSDLKLSVLVSNPPYIAQEEAAALPDAVRDWEPALALFADDGGMARYRALLEGAPAVLEQGGWVVLELDSTRAARTAQLAAQVGEYTAISVHNDLTGRPRILLAQRRSSDQNAP
jgi:release factor glutamine methyltransferase